MKYIRLFEERKNKKFWKVRPTSMEYAIIALDKIGIPKNNPYRKDLMRTIDASSDEKTFFVVYDSWSWCYTTNDKVGGFVNSGYEYMGEVKVEPHEVEAMKYNL
jgi:hypothetical protein